MVTTLMNKREAFSVENRKRILARAEAYLEDVASLTSDVSELIFAIGIVASLAAHRTDNPLGLYELILTHLQGSIADQQKHEQQ